ncbi:MAG: lysophospholipid acyltransferase family protein [Planctomycetota bacterium]|nr:lysophospholipid acyltransferase family protein [Planctomycetota bacterium]
MNPTQISVLAILGGLGLLASGWWLLHLAAARADGDRFLGLMKLLVTPLVKGYWGARFTGFERIPTPPSERGLIIVCNHTSGLDPVLITWKTPLRIRWLMSRAMMVRALGFLWRRLGILPIDFGSRDRAAFTDSVEILKRGGVLGIFPEGRIARPPEVIQPFLPGVGLMVAKTRATVVLMHSHGIRPGRTTFGVLSKPWRARVDVVDVVEYADTSLKAKAITADLRQRLHEASGWPLESISVEEARHRD